MENYEIPCSSSSVAAAAAAPISIKNAHGGSQSNEEDVMKIFLKVTKAVALKVKKSDTIENVKAKFRDVEGVPENLQELFFAGNHLSDGQKLADSNIQNYSTLHMVVQSMIAKQIFIKIPSTGRTLTLDVKPWDTIQNIKAIIHKEEQVPPDQQRLIYAGRTLEDGQTLATYLIEGTPTLHLIIHPRDELHVFVNVPDGETIPLEVKIWYKVEGVKVIIESILGFPLNLQQIVHAGEVLVDYRTLIDYKISHGSTLYLMNSGLVNGMQIFVKTWEGNTITLDVERSDTIVGVMDKIEKKVWPRSICHQHLIFSGRKLEANKTLADYNINKGSTVHLVMSPSRLVNYTLIKMPTGEVLSFQREMSSTIGDLKHKIRVATGYKCKKQILYYLGKVLRSQNTLESYGIPCGATLDLSVCTENVQNEKVK